MSVKEKHQKYRFWETKEEENKTFLFLSEGFVLNEPIKVSKIKKINGKSFSSGDRSAVFIDMKKVN